MRVRGTGPLPCTFMLVGEGPGRDDDRLGRPFVGKTGEELTGFLDGHRLPSREDVFLTNIYRQWGGKDYEYTPEDFARDEPELIEELSQCQPVVIIAMGRPAARYFLGDVDLDDVHGLPWWLPETFPHRHLFRTRPIIYPCYHIAAGFHSPDIAGTVLYDFQNLALLIEDKLKPRVLYDDPYAGQEVYREITRLEDIALDPTLDVHVDTEGWPSHPWSLQYAQRPGEGYLIRAPHRDLLREFERQIRAARLRVTCHSLLHELSMFPALGMATEGIDFDDTAIMAYLLQVEPKGLKPNCVRHCNMQMQSYDEVMGDAANRLAVDYFTALWDIEQDDYAQACQHEFERILTTPYRDKKGTIKFRKIRTLPKLPRTPLHKAVERGLRSRTPRKLWENWEDDQPHVYAAAIHRLGPMPMPTLDHVADETALRYACRDADGTGRVKPELWDRVKAMGLEEVYRLELETYPLIARMAEIGVKPDLAHFATLSRDLDFELADIQVRLESQTEIEGFNANSGDQVADFLFERLGLVGIKKTESGRFSTNDKVLEALEHEHPEYPVLSTIREFREVFKLKSTFVDAIPDYVHRWPYDGRVHATFRTTRVVTGRLAASDPNLLAQPKHGKFAKRFREGWIAAEGHWLGEWDLSQVELRVGAHLSDDPYMVKVYRGEVRNPDGSMIDLHAALAFRIFGVPPHLQDKSLHRLPAKAINFGFWMGQTKYGLMVELRKNGVQVSEDDAQRWIDEANAAYAGAERYKQAMIAQARRQGFIRCPLSGRIRYIGGIKSRDERVRAEAERFAFSTPIQEGAQALMKAAEASIWRDICVPYRRQGRFVEPLLQVHDAITLEFEQDRELARNVNTAMVEIMTRTPKGFRVPIETSGDYGLNMAQMEAFR